MKVVWLGQGGFLFISYKRKILIDPYLSNSLHRVDKNMRRGMKINKKFLKINPDVIILTNSHGDHTDLETIGGYIDKSKNYITVLSNESSYSVLKQHRFFGRYNRVLFESGSEWTVDNLNIKAVPAKTDDKSAIGILITDTETNKIYYVTGDTLYNKHIFEEIPKNIFALFVPINGEEGCMNICDAKRFADVVQARITVPTHFGMFDMTSPEQLECKNVIIPEIYKVLPLNGDENKRGFFGIKPSFDKKFNECISKSEKEQICLPEQTVENPEEDKNPYGQIPIIADTPSGGFHPDNALLCDNISENQTLWQEDSDEQNEYGDDMTDFTDNASALFDEEILSDETDESITDKSTVYADETVNSESSQAKECKEEAVNTFDKFQSDTGIQPDNITDGLPLNDFSADKAKTDIQPEQNTIENSLHSGEESSDNNTAPNIKTDSEISFENKDSVVTEMSGNEKQVPDSADKADGDKSFSSDFSSDSASDTGNTYELKRNSPYVSEKANDYFDDSSAQDKINSDKIDQYIKELEKFERGDTVDFDKIDRKNPK